MVPVLWGGVWCGVCVMVAEGWGDKEPLGTSGLGWRKMC